MYRRHNAKFLNAAFKIQKSDTYYLTTKAQQNIFRVQIFYQLQDTCH